MTYSDEISRALDAFHSYLAQNLMACERHPAARVSSFWTEHFADRRNYPDVREFITFRRGDFVYGIGDTGPATPEQKRREFEEVSKSIQLFTPTGFIERLREPVLGAPLVYPIGDTCLSASFVLNAGTAWRITLLQAQHGKAGSPLHVCEIGAGWGACASQLHQICDIASYTVIDLPENLCLSSTCLALGLSDRKAGFIACTPGDPSPPIAGTLNFGLPPAIDNLAGPYDLIINTMSFQEMDLETVDTYFRWAARVLAPGGLLVSFNSHDKAGVRHASQYLHEGLRLVHMAPFRKVPAGYFNTIPYEMVFRREDDARSSMPVAAVDALGELVQLGLDSDLRELAETALAAKSEQEPRYLAAMANFFYADDEQKRCVLLAQLLQEDDCVTHFVVGNYWYAQGNMASARVHLEKSLARGLRDFAAVRARVLLAVLDGEAAAAPLREAAAGLAGEVTAIISARDVAGLQNHIARVMDCPVDTPITWRALLAKARHRFVHQAKVE